MSKPLSKPQIITELQVNTNLMKKDIIKVFDALEKIVKEQIIKNKKIKLMNFGTLVLKDTKDRMGVNPKTKEKMKINGRKTIKLIVSDHLKKMALKIK
ncbi:MAG: HU family DNA-binding protein [Mycoplasmataceae bacterium]|jgi:DNA-binding protein HU-beta|nr:HU family DNA-binding protein [Mycoplasmataceae bacterium]